MLFEEQIARKPDLYPWAEEFIEAIWESFWTPGEFDFKADFSQFHIDMNDEEREIVARCLSAIGQIEIAVKTFWARLGDNLPHPGINDLGLVMSNSEVIHNKAYEKLLEKLELNHLFEENLKNPIVKGRVEYLRKYSKKVYTDEKKQYIYAIILFTLFVENVSLFSQFYVILWFYRVKQVLKDTAQQVQYTRNEELLHARVGIKIINTLRQEYPELFDDELEERIREECAEAIKAESAIIDWIVGEYSQNSVKDEGISASILKNYIKNRMDESLKSIGFQGVFEEAIDQQELALTLWSDEELLGNNMTDFFVQRPVEYARNNKSYSEEEDLF